MTTQPIKLKYITHFAYGEALPTGERPAGSVPVFGSNGVFDRHAHANTRSPAIVIGRKGSYGKINWSETDCFASDTTYFVDNTTTKQNLRWLFYALQTLGLDTGNREAAVPGLSRDTAYERLLPVPTADVQRAIAAFLDRETARLDGLVAQKEKLLALLEEKRASLITHAVTRGLDPNAPTKPSGIPWLGNIPKHWGFMKFGRVAYFQEGPGLRNWQFAESGVPVICVTNITSRGIDFEIYRKFISEAEYRQTYRHFTVQQGDLLLSSSGNSWGKVAEYTAPETTILNTSTIRINTSRTGSLQKGYLRWVLQADNVRKQLGAMMTGSCQPNFGPSHLNRAIVPVPPASEQNAIAAFIDDRTAKIDLLVSLLSTAIDKLRERRTAVISAAVTGQIDVRNWKPAGTRV